jgi:glutathione peroxidase-family protein
VEYIAQQRGLNSATGYLDSLETLTDDEDALDLISRVRINILYDSSRVQEAKMLTDTYEDRFADDEESKEWVRNMRYDLNYLVPGVKAPDFDLITLDGDSVSNGSLSGNPFLLEITPLASGLYQQEYDRLVAIHEVYKNYGLQIITVPLDESEVTIEAFYETRGSHWPAARPDSYNVQELIEKFNIQQVPTWILIDGNGDVVKKYVSDEIEDIIQGLGNVFSNPNDAS